LSDSELGKGQEMMAKSQTKSILTQDPEKILFRAVFVVVF